MSAAEQARSLSLSLYFEIRVRNLSLKQLHIPEVEADGG